MNNDDLQTIAKFLPNTGIKYLLISDETFPTLSWNNYNPQTLALLLESNQLEVLEVDATGYSNEVIIQFVKCAIAKVNDQSMLRYVSLRCSTFGKQFKEENRYKEVQVTIDQMLQGKNFRIYGPIYI
ncbi:hypothetical protein HDV01_003626 [Terramyces sp. JEL0728]|nr:hypothetical protein HDV01_003626 [Terramyces sp. JEL0728]